MIFKAVTAAAAGLLLVSGLVLPETARAQDVPNLLVMIEDSDKDTVPRDSRVQRNVLSGMNDRMNGRGYRVFDEQALGIDGYRATTASDRVRRTDQELIAVANTIDNPTIDVIVVYEMFASTDRTDFATFARIRLAGRMLSPQSGRFLGSFEVTTADAYKLPLNCPRECLLENLSEEGRDLGIELADVLADKLDQFFAPVTTGSQTLSQGGGASTGGFERTYQLNFTECSPVTRSEFEPYLVIFEGYIDHRSNRCSGTRCQMTYTSTINPGKLQRNLE
ncbi:MAG: hypothetical protein AAGI34_12590, partial [Pseudomonadota bacterium]